MHYIFKIKSLDYIIKPNVINYMICEVKHLLYLKMSACKLYFSII